MYKIENIGMELTQDEKGQLHGGFSLQSSSNSDSGLWSDNGNCKGGGWFDDNVNCNRCADCDHHAPVGIPQQQP